MVLSKGNWPLLTCILASILSTTSSSSSCDGGGENQHFHHYLIQHRAKRDLDFGPDGSVKPRVCAKGDAICIPSNYSKFDLPDESLTTVSVGIDIKDIPKIDDKEFSITLNAFFVVRWTDARMIIDQVRQIMLETQTNY